jgi:diamine N-acetyltransferase
MTVEKEQDWYDQHSRAENDVPFTIYERNTLRPIGNTGLHGVDYRTRTTTFGTIGEPECRGKGYGTETTRLMLDYAFTALGLHNLMLIVFEFNVVAGVRAYEKAGFKEFRRRRECRLSGGKLWDEIKMDCLSSELESSVLRCIYTPDDA